MEFFRGKTIIFKEFFRGEQRFHGIFREKSTFSRISSGVDPFLREVFRGECNLVEFFRGKKKSYSSTGGVRILNAIAQYGFHSSRCETVSLYVLHQNTLSRSSKAERNYAKEYSTAEE